MEVFNEFIGWAWERHHNLWSWYIRPLFVIPYCYFAFKRSLAGILLTLLALLTSMFWFPAPAVPHPAVVSALEAERIYLTEPWTLPKLALSLLVPATLIALARAFWVRSFLWGAVVLNGIAFIKIGWTAYYFDSKAFLSHLAPAVTGLFVCKSLLVIWYRHTERISAKAGSAKAAADSGLA